MATIDLTLSDDEAQPSAPAPAVTLEPPRRRKRDILDSSSSDNEAPAPAPAAQPPRRRKRDVLDSSDEDEPAPTPDEATATARAAANLKGALAAPAQDLTLSSDDDAPKAKKQKRPTTEPAEPENVVSRRTVETAITTATKWRGTRQHVNGGDDVDEDEDVTKARRLMRTTQAYEDVEFPASVLSLKGKESDQPPPPSDPSQPPSCSCGHRAGKATVKKEGSENKSRPYWHCPSRRCALFQWADRPPPKPLTWARMEASVPVVTDAGFSADDLAQGGLGDCWFLAALSVVAERHDLIARLFVETPRNTAGAYALRLFMDGLWTTVVVDDRLPCTEKPRRENTVADVRRAPLVNVSSAARLAYVRSRCAQTERMTNVPTPTLWASLIEKAYAKAHGSYQSISGGQIAEALLDLTGYPTFAMNLGDRGFDSEKLWRNVVKWKRLGYPMGCATDPVPDLREVGLCGSHAYSIVDARTVRYRGNDERLLRIRNPHGVGEWNGDWSDQSEKWNEVVRSDPTMVRPTRDDDGTFWMDYTHFLMGFSRVDVCAAPPQTHARSFGNSFPPKKAAWRVGACFYRVRGAGDVFVTALQPTKRGAWCRADRKKSYRPGDLQVVAYDLTAKKVLGALLRGADVYDRGALAVDLKGKDVLIYVYCLGANPAAAETRAAQPFRVRFVSVDGPLQVEELDFEAKRHGAMALEVLHGALTRRKERSDDLLFAAARAPALNVVKAQDGAFCATTQGEGLVVVTVVNESDRYKTCAVVYYCKSAQARSVDGVLENVKDRVDAYYERLKALTPKPDPRAPPQRGPRFPAKWKAFVATADLPPRSRRVALAVVRSGSQYELGDIDCAFYDAAPPQQKGQQRIDAFVGASKSRTALDADGLFAAVALPESYTGAVPVVDDDLAEALRRSRGDDVEHDDLEGLADAIRRSRDGGGADGDDDLAEALRRSREDAAPPPPPLDPDAELAEALRRSREDGAPKRDVVKTSADHPICLDDSQEDAEPIVLDESQDAEPARPSLDEVRAARLARLG